jgi:hypothetical protein
MVYVFMYVCTYESRCVIVYVGMYVCMYVSRYLSVSVGMYSMHVSRYIYG